MPRDREDRQWRARCRRVVVRRCRWLGPEDLEVLRGLRVTRPEVTAIHLAAGPPAVLRAYLVDGRHQGWLDLAAVRARLARLGPVQGRHRLRAHLDELEHRAPESVFHDGVLDTLLALGYAPTTHPVSVPTATGRAVSPDIPLERWRVAIELDGDAFHRDRVQRRRDRDRLAAYATTDWRPVVVDWRSWHDERETLLATLDAAIEAQRRRGIGTQHPPPRRAGSVR